MPPPQHRPVHERDSERTELLIVHPAGGERGVASLARGAPGPIEVARLAAGDVAVGDRVLIERKMAEDFLASLSDGRLFRQAMEISRVSGRPLLIVEEDSSTIPERLKGDQFRGFRLALTVGFRIPILESRNVEDTAAWIRQIAVQEARREARRRRAAKTPQDKKERGGPRGDPEFSTQNCAGDSRACRIFPEIVVSSHHVLRTA